MLELLNRKLEEEKILMKDFEKRAAEHIKTYGLRECAYLRYRQDMELYYRGRVELIQDLIRNIK